MTDPRDLPLIDFDPREEGPIDTARRKWSELKTWITENQLLAGVGATLLTGILIFAAAEGFIPPIPNWLRVALIVSILGSGTYILIGMRSADALYRPDAELLVELDAGSGDLGLKRLAPERFDQLEVESPNGKERSKDVLREIRVNGIRAFEVARYNEEENLAVTSWQADASNREIRLHKNRLREVKTELEEEVDQTFELLINSSSIVREHSSEIANEIIHVAEEVETPTDSTLSERLAERLEEANPDEDLLGDNEVGDDVEEESNGSNGTLADRVTELENHE